MYLILRQMYRVVQRYAAMCTIVLVVSQALVLLFDSFVLQSSDKLQHKSIL